MGKCHTISARHVFDLEFMDRDKPDMPAEAIKLLRFIRNGTCESSRTMRVCGRGLAGRPHRTNRTLARVANWHLFRRADSRSLRKTRQNMAQALWWIRAPEDWRLPDRRHTFIAPGLCGPR